MEDITALLFDIDGTVLDTTEFILQATEHALAVAGYPVLDRSEITKVVGVAFPDYYIKLTGEDTKIDTLIEAHRTFQHSHMDLAKLFPNALSTLKTLKEKGYILAAVTSRSNKTSNQTLIDTVVSLEDAVEPKPHPAQVLKALDNLNESPESAVMIGDSYLDILAGKNAGTRTIRATYGFNAENLHDPEPDNIVGDIADLLKLF